MPFGTYLTPADALHTAAKIIKHGRMGAVKLEGGNRVIPQVKAICSADIPVMGHIGLTPQSVSALGGFKVQGKTAHAAAELLDSALALQDAGCFSIVLESVPDRIAEYITNKLDIPTIGIGAGPNTSGQVQVFHDIIGLFDRFLPKFSQRYAFVGQEIHKAVSQYKNDVTSGEFPAKQHCFTIKDSEYEAFLNLCKEQENGTITSESAADSNLSEGESVEGLYGSVKK
jgi:3-methyl-2-oxobutanoate hydroxymethyltransferase